MLCVGQQCSDLTGDQYIILIFLLAQQAPHSFLPSRGSWPATARRLRQSQRPWTSANLRDPSMLPTGPCMESPLPLAPV